MRNQNGMIRHGLIQVFENKHSSFRRLRVVILETEDPLSGRGLGRPLAKSLLNRFDGSQIAIHVSQVRAAGGSRVRVGINESRQNGFPTQIDFPASGTGDVKNLVVRAYGQEPSATHCDSLSARIFRIDGPKFPVVENQVRLQSLQGHKGESPERYEETAT
jgi:hypothetical protein